MKKVALYDPYLDVMGGGERHILSILKVIEDTGCKVTIYWDRDLTGNIKEKLNIVFQHGLTFLPKFKDLSSFDYFFYVTDGSYFFSSAKKTFIFCMYPKRELYQMNLLNRLKTWGNRFVANSKFTANYLSRWGVKPTVLYPYIPDDLFTFFPDLRREPIILSVGRFFRHLHAKRQDIMIDAFLKFKEMYPSDLKLVLAGGVKKEDEEYVAALEKKASVSKDITFLKNVSYEKIKELYRTSSYYWHFAGWGIDEEKEPHAVEHLGITPLEAMAGGSIPFAYKAGGPKELITSGQNGYLFFSEEELFKKMQSVMNNVSLQRQLRENASRFVREYFRYDIFKKNVMDIIL